jgi:hypothetical protein
MLAKLGEGKGAMLGKGMVAKLGDRIGTKNDQMGAY